MTHSDPDQCNHHRCPNSQDKHCFHCREPSRSNVFQSVDCAETTATHQQLAPMTNPSTNPSPYHGHCLACAFLASFRQLWHRAATGAAPARSPGSYAPVSERFPIPLHMESLAGVWVLQPALALMSEPTSQPMLFARTT